MAEEERDIELEDLFRKKLEGSEIDPGSDLTGRFMSRLEHREFFRFNPFRFNLYYLTAAAAAILAAGILIFSHSDEGRQKPVTNNPVPQAETRVRTSDPPAAVAGITEGKIVANVEYTPAPALPEESPSAGGMPSPVRNNSIIISPRQEAVSLKVAGQIGADVKRPAPVAAVIAEALPELPAPYEIPETDTCAGDDMFMRFPNAFIPSTGGPTGGYFSQRTDEAGQVFHPVASGVSSCNLKIYSKVGMIVFESDDLSMGWDGYYKGQLCSPGVYIWKASGSWRNGQAIVMAGDVTLLKY